MSLHSPRPGDTLAGKYRIVRLLGQGGMGAVLEAENLLTKRHVAIKWLARPGGADGEARLLREAQATARVKHRNVVDVYDVGLEGDALFLVMELLEGETLAHVLATRTLPIPAFLRLLLPVMRGAAEAHRQGVLHRDVKPENIFLAREVDETEPTPKLLDFGVAKLQDLRGLTHTGHAIGTPLFMPLEQLRGARDLDARVDVYGFGVILYLALTGQPPYWGATLPDLALKAATTDPLPPRELRPELPEALSDVVLRAVARLREQRIASLDELARGLAPFASQEGYLTHAETVAHTRAPRLELLDIPSHEEAAEAPAGAAATATPPTRQVVTPVAMQPTPASFATSHTPIPGGSQPAPRAGRSRVLALVLGSALLALAAVVALQAWPMREHAPAAAVPPMPALPARSAPPALGAETQAHEPVQHDAALSAPVRERAAQATTSPPAQAAPAPEPGRPPATEASRRRRARAGSAARDAEPADGAPPTSKPAAASKPPAASKKAGFTVDEFLGGVR